jgi:ADP-heptose:LPS heptosyltransferase
VEKFLIINPFGIGDVLFTTPVVRALKKKYPDSFIGYWCNERVAPLLKTDPAIDKIFDLSRGDIKRVYKGLKRFTVLFNLIKEIRRERFTVSFDFSLDSRYGLWSKLAGVRKRIGFDYKERGRFLTERIGLKGYSARHVMEYYADLLKFIGIEPDDKAPALTVSRENDIKAKEKLSMSGVTPSTLLVGVAMGGGASWGRDAIYKQWPAERFGQLAGRLIKDSNAYIILLGSPDEKPLAEIASAA